ncbi:MAG: family 2 glycosyl transferase [Candidatus Marinimicrobia bacterium]|nr:family 2 glycosyl transferase [Candidatus Neomarinimicrobiota bacterium]
MKLSVLIPAKDEEGDIEETISKISKILTTSSINHEIIVINDHSNDSTFEILQLLEKNIRELKIINNEDKPGYGLTIRLGLENYTGDIIAIMMADGSDSPDDLMKFYFKSIENNSCVFGSRFSYGGTTNNYPKLKYVLNRIFNNLVRLIFQINYNDFTNAFKVYTKEAIEGSKPFLSNHFNLTLELPLKIIIRGYKYEIIPNSWENRKTGISKMKIKEMGSRYLFILLYCLIEKLLTKNDYKKNR